MKKQDFTTRIVVDATAKKAFKNINAVTKWWTENLDGRSEKLNDEFTVRFGDVHVSKQKLTELVPGKKVEWLVTDSKLNFVENKSEWTGTKIIFELTEKGSQTEIRFTHQGLTPNVACCEDCSNAWSEYIQGSLKQLINTGTGQPTPKVVSKKPQKK